MCDGLLHYTARVDALLLDESLRLDVVSGAWVIWSKSDIRFFLFPIPRLYFCLSVIESQPLRLPTRNPPHVSRGNSFVISARADCGARVPTSGLVTGQPSPWREMF